MVFQKMERKIIFFHMLSLQCSAFKKMEIKIIFSIFFSLECSVDGSKCFSDDDICDGGVIYGFFVVTVRKFSFTCWRLYE